MKKTIIILLMFFGLTANAQDIFSKIPELQNTSIIAVGESAHGVSDFSEIKVSLFKSLAERGYVGTFLIESNFSATYAINKYINSEQKLDVDSLMGKSLYRVWQTTEMKNLILWMKEFNRREKDGKLSFFGFDSQSSEHAVKYVESYLNDSKIKLEEPSMQLGIKLISEMAKAPNYNFKRLSKDDRELLENTVTILDSLIVANSDEQSIVRLHMKVIHHTLENEKAGIFSFFNVRDKNMAELVDSLLTFTSANQGFFIWAHNGHISKARRSLFKPMGRYINNRHSDDFLVIAQDFYKGKVSNTYSSGVTNYDELEDNKWIGNEIKFDDNLEYLVIDNKNIGKCKIRDIGATGGVVKIKSNRQFDYIIYSKKVQSANFLDN